MKVQIVSPYRVSHLLPNGVTVRGNVTSVYPSLDRATIGIGTCCLEPLNLGTFHNLSVPSISGIDQEVEEYTYSKWN
jgi:hypothetical protein